MTSLGVNIDHVATVRNARGGSEPDPVKAALLAEAHGADGITAHLREDRRHIRDEDMKRLKAEIKTRLNMEMANTEEMVSIALALKPYMVTLVPERREELTTEGGLDVAGYLAALQSSTATLQNAGILVSMFIDADPRQVEATHASGAKVLEFHTGPYCEKFAEGGQNAAETELQKLISAAQLAVDLGIEVNAGHGLNYENVKPILKLPGIHELNIGHSIVAQSIVTGLGPAVQQMKDLITP